MSIDEMVSIATGGKREIQDDWMPATAIRPLFSDDPGIIWLDHYGGKEGFKPDSSPYAFLTFIAKKGRQFEEKWKAEMAKSAVTVCGEDYEVRSFDKVLETIRLIWAGTPIIARPALWLETERVYGVPDLIVHTSWLKDAFPKLVPGFESESPASNMTEAAKPGHYVVFDLKFTTGLDESAKKKDLLNYGAQTRIYSYALGVVQGLMPQNAFLSGDPINCNEMTILNKYLEIDCAALSSVLQWLRT